MPVSWFQWLPREVGSYYTGFSDAVISDNFIELQKMGNYRKDQQLGILNAVL